MSRYAALPDFIRRALTRIVPSKAGEMAYYPCRVTLKSGECLDTVYIEPEKSYIDIWGVFPEEDRGKRWIRIEDIADVEDSPARLPARFANEVYSQGESGMGYTIFTVVFSDGKRQACVTGNDVDFIHYPSGKGQDDVIAVEPHEGRREELVRAPEWYWCLYSEDVE